MPLPNCIDAYIGVGLLVAIEHHHGGMDDPFLLLPLVDGLLVHFFHHLPQEGPQLVGGYFGQNGINQLGLVYYAL